MALWKAVFPTNKNKGGIPAEAQLMEEGLDVLTVDPNHLGRYIKKAKALGIHVMDPFGLGPASSTFARILNTGEPYLAKYFRLVLEKPEVRVAKRRGLRIIVGGPGVWQFKYRPEFLDEHGIDCAVGGEAEKVVGELSRRALDDEELLIKCLKHDLYWAKVIMHSYFLGEWYGPLLSPIYRFFVWLERRARAEAILD